MTLDAWLRRARSRLEAAGCPDPEVDAEWLAVERLGLPRSALRREGSREIGERDAEALEKQLKRRESREPLQYILGHAPFLRLDILCDRRALIPRPETEYMTDMALSAAPGAPFGALDLCCGTGAIGLSVKKEKPWASVTLSDISPDALALARENAHRAGLAVEFCQGDLFAPLAGRRFDLILCNPPYLTGADMEQLQAEVAREPETALDGGRDGLDFYRRIAENLKEHLYPGGRAWFELGLGQAGDVAALMESAGKTEIVRDLSGVERFVTVYRTV